MRWLSALSLAAAVPAVAQQPPPAQPPAVWELDWRPPYCTITTGDPKSVSLSIWSVPGSMTAELYFIGRVPKLPQGAEAQLQLLPSGATSQAKVFWPKPNGTGLIAMTVHDDPDFLEKLAQANQLAVTAAGQPLTIAVHGAAKPMQALKGCIDDKLREWGVDPATLPSAKARPKGDLNSWITAQDYPTDALDSDTSGTVVVRLTTDPKGRVINCVAVENTGTRSMAQTTCRAALSRARYKPVIGPDGQPISSSFITYTTFRVFD
jgi:TonB family protein